MSGDDLGEGSFFDAAFIQDDSSIQPEYPSPDVAQIQTQPYLVPTAKSATQAGAYDDTDDAIDSAWRYKHRPELRLALAIPPNQRTSGSNGDNRPSVNHKRDDSGLGTSPLSAVSKEQHTLAQESPGLGSSHAGARRDAPDNTTLFPDNAGPYVTGNGKGRYQDLRCETDILVAVAGDGQIADSEFVCDHCGRSCVSKPSLKYVAKLSSWFAPKTNTISHHVLKHDLSIAHKHRCPRCGKGFRYPKDVERHVDAVHENSKRDRFPCGDCNKTYARKDHRQRHLKRQGHSAPRNLAGSSSSAVSGQQNQRFARNNPRESTRARLPSSGNVRSSTRHVLLDAETSNQADQFLHPWYQRILPSSSAPTSTEDTRTTISDADSFLSLL